MKKLPVILLSALILLLVSCDKNTTWESNPISKGRISGVIQKGPFMNGSSVSIIELGANYAQTGKIFSTQISDNTGTFYIDNVGLISPYIQLQANGFYFNEVTGKISDSPITLYAISDVTNKDLVNVNILSHLEKGRIEYLISKGSSFDNAKKQAKSEVLSIFLITKSDIADFELLDITSSGENNAILLAASIILQGFRTEAELSSLLADISSDIKEDGKLDNVALNTKMINDAVLVDLPKIRANIESHYSDANVTIPNFEKYVEQFIANTSYKPATGIEYPEFSGYGENILFGDKTEFTSTKISLAANLAKGAALKIVITGGTWYYRTLPDGPVNWTISRYDMSKQQQIFTVTESGKGCDLSMIFEAGTHKIEYYENNSSVPTRVKILTLDKTIGEEERPR